MLNLHAFYDHYRALVLLGRGEKTAPAASSEMMYDALKSPASWEGGGKMAAANKFLFLKKIIFSW